MINRNSSAWLLKTRKMMNLTRKQLSEKTGLSYVCIEQIENGKRKGNTTTWNCLHNALPSIDYSDDGTPILKSIDTEV